MSGVPPGPRGLKSKTSELNLFRDRGSNTSRLRGQDHLTPPVPSLATPDSTKPKRRLALWGKRRKSGSVSPSPSARPSGDSVNLPRKSGETSASPYRTVQGLLTSSVQDLTPTRLPSKLPPLDVSPPSLDFSTSLSPFSSRNQASLGGKHLVLGGISSRDRTSPVKAHSNRPLITVAIPPSNPFNEADDDIFVSPRSAPTPPQLAGLPDDGSPATPFSPSAPGSPLRFPIPPSQEDISASNSFPDTLLRGRSSEFNTNFSFPRKEDGANRNTGRNTSLDISPTRPPERKMNLRKVHSTTSKSQVSYGPGLELPRESLNAKVPQPPSIPLPVPPSVFPIDTDDNITSKLPITTSMSSSIFVPTRVRPKTASSSSSSPQKDKPQADERAVLQQPTRRRGERRNPLAGDQRDQILLRVEVGAQRTQLDELAAKFQEFTEENAREKKELIARLADVEHLVEEQRKVIKNLELLVPYKDSGRFYWGRDIAEIMARTPELGSSMFSPVVAFENRSLSLKRSNTLPDGHLDWVRRQGTREADGKRISHDWSQFISGVGLVPMDRRGGELPDSPVVREGSEATLVSSPSDPTSRGTHEARSGADRDAAMLDAGEGAPDYERMKQWTPNMEEILAKLRTFECGSPIGK